MMSWRLKTTPVFSERIACGGFLRGANGHVCGPAGMPSATAVGFEERLVDMRSSPGDGRFDAAAVVVKVRGHQAQAFRYR